MSSQSLLSYETFVRALAGASGSVFAMTAFYPLDTIRFRLQLEGCEAELKKLTTWEAMLYVVQKEGFESLYRGITPVLQSLGVSNFVYFYTFHALKKLDKSAHNELILGVIAGIVNVLSTLPLWVVNSRLKIDKQSAYSGLFDGMVHIANTEGLRALWNGLGPSLMLVVNPAIQFTLYEALKRRIPAKTATSFFLLGALAKAGATIATYPLQVAQARQRHGQNKDMGTLVLLLSIIKRSGPAALFQGLEAKLLQTCLTAALMFTTYEKIVRFVFMVLMRKSVKAA